MTRILPGVYISLNDYSTLPEGQNNLTVGYVLKANRGPLNKCELVTSPTDFLTKYTFTGSPAPNDDTTFWSILQVLRQTNQVYVVRVAKNAKFGGLLIKKQPEAEGRVLTTTLPELQSGSTSVYVNGGKITVAGDATAVATANSIIRLFGNKDIQGRYKVTSSAYTPVSGQAGSTEIVLAVPEDGEKDFIKMPKAYSAEDEDDVRLYKVVEPTARVTGLTPEEVEGYATGTSFTSDDLFLITGVDEGAYNNDIAISITSCTESPDALDQGNVFTINVYDANTGALLENQFMCSRDPQGKAFDGTATYLNTVLEASAYIRGYNNDNVKAECFPSDVFNAKLGGGTDGDEVTETDMIGGLQLYADKTVAVSILGNGSTESKLFQQQMINIAETRKDCVAFINDKLADEKATLNSTKAENIINYKKGELGSTSFYATMYAPHVNYPDVFNSRTVKLGADATAIAGWLNVIANQGYPFAYAGPTYGLVSGVTTDWKIGDTSGEAERLNDASINYVAYDAKVGRYYMQTQNTLQIANSALRNLGAVLNVLDIKETFAVYFKEYLQRPITSSLRAEILLRGNDQMKLMLSQGRVTDYSFVDASTDADIADNTLRYVLTLALTPYAQKIYLVMNIVNQSFDFSILQSA